MKFITVSFGVAAGDELLQAGANALVDEFTGLLVHFPHLQDQSL
ncbi:MAG: hypothetical protein Q9M82_05260 [Mariprofundus sp.]|nr:hypothetical protein [Mariprofundus sp.]